MAINNIDELYTFCRDNNFLIKTDRVAKRNTCGCGEINKEDLAVFRIRSGLGNACIYLSLYIEDPKEIQSSKFYNELSNGINISTDIDKFLLFFNSKLSLIKEVNNITE